MPIMYYVLIVSFAAGIISQLVKFLLKVAKHRKFSWHSLDAYGGMPSSHSSFLLALLTAVGLEEGVKDPLFGVVFIIAAIIIRDAFGLRMILEEQGKLIMKIIKDLPQKDQILATKKDKAFKNHLIGHRIGHTIPEILVGSVIGIVVALAGYFLFH